jgi:hypothetical protein
MMGDFHDLVEMKINELAWFMYRESAKTSFAKGGLLYLLAYGLAEYPNVDSLDGDNSERILYDITWELQTNKRFIEDFGELHVGKRTQDQVSQKRVSNFVTNPQLDEQGNILRIGARVEAHTTNEDARGFQHNSKRPDFLLLDDFETKKSVRSEALTRSVRDHISEFKGGVASGSYRILYLGNYFSEYANIQSIIDRANHDPKLRVRIVPICDGTLNDLHDPSWPSRWVLTDEEAKTTGKASIESKQRSMWTPEEGDADFQAEMLCQPIDETKTIFKREWFQSITWEVLIQKKLAAYVTMDTPSRREGEVNPNGDYVGICINWIDREGKWHLKSWREKLGPTGIIEKMFGIHSFLIQAGTPAIKFGWEDTAFTRGLEPMLRHEQRMRQIFLPLMWLKHQGRSKEDRIRTGLLYRYETRSIYHLQGECKDLEHELVRFPNSEHDDTSDATAYQSDIARPAGTEKPRGTELEPIVFVDTAYGKVKSAYEDDLVDVAPQYPDIGI